MSDSRFTNFETLALQSRNRKIVFFGAGIYAAKTARKLDNEIIFIADNNTDLWNTQEIDLSITDPKELIPYVGTQEVYIIICSTSFQEISTQLEGYGFRAMADYAVTPVLNDLRIIGQMESVSTKLLFSSGSPKQDDPKFGGGIYELTLDGYNWDYRKVHSGICHGIYRKGDKIIAVDQSRGILEMNLNYEVVREGSIPDGSRCHGISWSTVTERYYVVASHMDKVLVYTEDLQLEKTISISDKHDRFGEPEHHANDICAFGHSIFVSMFSLSGNFKESDIYDGVVLEIDIETHKVRGPVIRDLWMPHNVAHHAGSLVVLDSLPGYLRKNNAQVVGEFPGFTRGLAFDGTLFYIGQSRNRNYSKYMGFSNNVSIDAAIVIFDEHTKVSRSLQLPPQVSEIHSIVLLDR